MRRHPKRLLALGLAAGVVVTLAAVALAIACGRLDTRTSPLGEGVLAPDFALPDSNDRIISLADLTARGPAVVVFYRGHW